MAFPLTFTVTSFTHILTLKAFDYFFIIYNIVVSFLVKLKTPCHKKLANNTVHKSFFHNISFYICQKQMNVQTKAPDHAWLLTSLMHRKVETT